MARGQSRQKPATVPRISARPMRARTAASRPLISSNKRPAQDDYDVNDQHLSPSPRKQPCFDRSSQDADEEDNASGNVSNRHHGIQTGGRVRNTVNTVDVALTDANSDPFEIVQSVEKVDDDELTVLDGEDGDSGTSTRSLEAAAMVDLEADEDNEQDAANEEDNGVAIEGDEDAIEDDGDVIEDDGDIIEGDGKVVMSTDDAPELKGKGKSHNRDARDPFEHASTDKKNISAGHLIRRAGNANQSLNPSTPPNRTRAVDLVPEDTPDTPDIIPHTKRNVVTSSPLAGSSSHFSSPTVQMNRLNFTINNKNKVSTLTRNYFNAAVCTRINRLLEYNDAKGHCYSARYIPSSVALGPAQSASGDRSSYVCLGDEPITVWLVGEVVELIHSESFSITNPTRRVAITFRPFFADDFTAVRRMLVRTSNSTQCPTADDATQTLVARRWMADPGVEPDSVPRFDDYYNALKGWRGAESSEYMKATDIAVNDVVVVEANVLKTIPTETVKTSRGGEFRRKLKDQWETELELLSVALLFRAPKYVPKKKSAAAAI